MYARPIWLIVLLGMVLQADCFSRSNNTLTVLGTGYVGLVTGVGFAYLGNRVICADINKDKIHMLQQNTVPFFEPGLQELVQELTLKKHLSFTDNVADAIDRGDILFIAVGTPSGQDGHADLSALFSVLDTIICTIKSYKIIVIKSTVPLMTNKKIEQYILDKGVDHRLFDIVSNPEFLREGSAVYDFLNPDRIIIGGSNQISTGCIAGLYKPLKDGAVPVIVTDTTSAELIKYASNAFLATKISFINEMANLCDGVGADIATVAHGMGLDERINNHFLRPGPGFGGSCFPKDSLELLATSLEYNVPLEVVKGLLAANNHQQSIAVKKVKDMLGANLREKTVCILGLSFKANTDDIRYSPAIKTIELLQSESATIKAYDPLAMEHMAKLFPEVGYCSSADEAICDADAIIILTEWDEFKCIDWKLARTKVNNPCLVDMRNILDPFVLMQEGFLYNGIGKGLYNIQ